MFKDVRISMISSLFALDPACAKETNMPLRVLMNHLLDDASLPPLELRSGAVCSANTQQVFSENAFAESVRQPYSHPVEAMSDNEILQIFGHSPSNVDETTKQEILKVDYNVHSPVIFPPEVYERELQKFIESTGLIRRNNPGWLLIQVISTCTFHQTFT